MPGLLVVEEDAGYREKLRQSFAGQYQVLVPPDAEKALACIRSGGAAGISAVILSLTLPEDGAAVVLGALRQESAFWELPVLAAIPEGESPETLPLSMEADDYYCKDHPIAALQRRMRRLTETVASHQRESILQDQANRDQLTGLLNRRGLQAAMAALRKEELPLAVYLFDLDDLKRANDCLGHSAGDRMLTHFADVLRRNTRSGDILCRYGGDEFAVILKGIRSEDTVRARGDAICRGMAGLRLPDGPSLTCSGGAVLCMDPGTSAEVLIEQADQALYQAKRQNKGTCLLRDKQA